MSELRGFKFIGCPEIEPVPLPEGTELSFASIVSAVTGATVDEAHRILVKEELSQEDGSTAPMGEERVAVGKSVLEIKPVLDPFSADTPETALERIDEQLVAVRAVALLYKKREGENDDQYHWALFTGYLHGDKGKGSYRIMDPLKKNIDYWTRDGAKKNIKQSIEFMGVYAYSLDTREE